MLSLVLTIILVKCLNEKHSVITISRMFLLSITKCLNVTFLLDETHIYLYLLRHVKVASPFASQEQLTSHCWLVKSPKTDNIGGSLKRYVFNVFLPPVNVKRDFCSLFKWFYKKWSLQNLHCSGLPLYCVISQQFSLALILFQQSVRFVCKIQS